MVRPLKATAPRWWKFQTAAAKRLLNVFDFAQRGGDLTSPETLGDCFLLEQGFTLVWLGWEFDVPDQQGMLRATCRWPPTRAR